MRKNSSHNGRLFWITLLTVLVMMAVPAAAEWKQDASGNYVYYDGKGKAQSSTWIASENAGLVTVGSDTYCYKLDGSAYHGFITDTSGKRYYADAKGQILKSKWISLKQSGKTQKYRAGKDGVIYCGKRVKVGSYTYAFGKNGVMLFGKQKFGSKYYFFKKNSGRMAKSTYIVSDGNRYYAQKNGSLAVKKWVGRYYFGKTGKALKNGWVGDRYVGSNGKYLTGLKMIGTASNFHFYYFDDSTGKKLTNTTKTVKGETFTFDSNGWATSNSRYETQYYTDPSVSDEDLLATIIYCESGNQPYYGQLAVGLVITNRVRSSQFPDSIKGVIYSKTQFEPARTGVLTRYLENQSLVSDTSKKAAKEVLKMYSSNSYKITVDKKKISMKDYLFFMTPAAYARLGLTTTTLKLEGHVFFKTWG